VHSTRSESDKVYQLLAHGRWFYLGTPASSTLKTGHHDIAEILLKVALNTINHNHKSSLMYGCRENFKYKTRQWNEKTMILCPFSFGIFSPSIYNF
jgi:hypothetical protein